MKYELLIFDWDGTLMDSQARIISCMQAAAKDAQAPMPTAESVRDIIGLSLNEAMHRLFPGHDEALFQHIRARYRHHFVELDKTPEQLFSGADKTLKELEKDGYLLAVATGKSRLGLDRSILATGLANRFHITRCADETRGKPHPQMLEEILQYLGVEVEAALMIGDTEWDLLMASSLGMHAAAVTYGAHETDRLRGLEPVILLDDITALPIWLGSAH